MTDTNHNDGGDIEKSGTVDIAAAEAAAASRPTAEDRAQAIENAKEHALSERRENLKPADIGAAKPGNLEASGAFIEDGAKKAIDVSHPAVDNNPRAGTTERQNQVDFNNPHLYDDEAVTANLANG